jgi:LysR family transcriptional activator of nhaA
MSSLNFHHLRYFLAVASEGNLTRAAHNLSVSQSALSTQIQTLEARLGHALFERVGHVARHFQRNAPTPVIPV